MTLRSYFFAGFQQITIRLGIFTNFKALSLSGLTDFCLLVPVKCGKNRGTKQQLCMCITLFSKFLRHPLRNDVKPHNARFYGRSESTTTNFPSSFWTWIMLLRIQLCRRNRRPTFDNFGRVRIDAIILNGRKVIFLATFSIPSSLSLLKLPITRKARTKPTNHNNWEQALWLVIYYRFCFCPPIFRRQYFKIINKELEVIIKVEVHVSVIIIVLLYILHPCSPLLQGCARVAHPCRLAKPTIWLSFKSRMWYHMRVEFWGPSIVFSSPPKTAFPNSGEQPCAASYSSLIFTYLNYFIS